MQVPYYTTTEFKDMFDVGKYFGQRTYIKIRGKQKIHYLEDFSTADTEVYTFEHPDDEGRPSGTGLLYIWQMCVFGICVYGRTMDEFKEFVDWLSKKLMLSNKRRMVAYVHNLEYDAQFMRAVLPKATIFATDARAILTMVYRGVEFRCSYKLTNMNLYEFTHKMGAEHAKVDSDDYDYDKLRTPDMSLEEMFDEEQLKYVFYDVLGLYEALHIKMRNDHDNIATVPLTSTGYVRRDCMAAMRKNPKNRDIFDGSRLSVQQYRKLRDCFRGGNCHANRKYAGLLLDNVVSYDMASAYPAVIMYSKFPVKKFKPVKVSSIKDLETLIQKDYALIIDATFEGISTTAPIPYIPISKCNVLSDFTNDNGRVLRASRARLIMTEADFRLIISQYKIKTMTIHSVEYSQKDYLPIELRRVLSKYFKDKTMLKGIKEEEYAYGKSKNLLNAIFGMCVQDPIHFKVKVNENGEWETSKARTDADIEPELDSFYKSLNSFLPYQWGVWITSECRVRLQEAIDIVGDKMVYCDTDSVKFIYDQKLCDKIDKINDRIIKLAEASDVSCIEYTKAGKKQILGLWDNEGIYEKFKTYGAKKYAVVKNGKFEVTVSGLNKDKGAEEIGDIKYFITGLTIENSGRTRSVYDDNIEAHYIEVNGKQYKIYSNVAILKTTYTLGVSKEYEIIAPNVVVHA